MDPHDAQLLFDRFLQRLARPLLHQLLPRFVALSLPLLSPPQPLILTPHAVYFAIVLVFSVLGNFSLGILRYRINEGSILGRLWENLKWIPLLSIFLGGISLHISQALVFHFLGIPMEWGATSKESENVGFFKAISRVMRKFKISFLFCTGMTACMIAMAFALEKDWQIKEMIAVWPMATVIVSHFLLPLVLNPQLMTFTW